jgi:hypothetical protein
MKCNTQNSARFGPFPSGETGLRPDARETAVRRLLVGAEESSIDDQVHVRCTFLPSATSSSGRLVMYLATVQKDNGTVGVDQRADRHERADAGIWFGSCPEIIKQLMSVNPYPVHDLPI